MSKMDCAGDGGCGLGGVFGGKGTFLDDLREGLAFDQFHREKMLTAVFPYVVNGDDVWMLERGGRLSFSTEARDEWIAGELAEEKGFDGDDPVERNLAGAKDDAHAAAGDLVEEFVIAHGGAGFGVFFFWRRGAI